LEATGSVGSVSVVAEANVFPTGVSAAGGIGSVVVNAGAVIDIPSGLQAQGFVHGGFIEVNADATAPVTGLEATVSVGSVTVETKTFVFVTGLEATADVGDVAVVAKANVSVTGVSASGLVNHVLVWGPIVPNQNAGYNPIAPTQTPTWGETTPAQTPDWNDIAA
jgi:hypothetical protein